MLRFSVLVMILMLMACVPSETPTDIEFSTATARPIDSIPSPDAIGDTDIPFDFIGGDPIILLSQGTFDFAVSGEFVAQFDTGTLLYNYLPNTGGLSARNQLYISTSDSISSQELSFEFSPDIPIGQYNLLTPENYFDGGVSVSYTRLAFDGTSTRVQAFTDNLNGYLILTSVGEVLSGQFQFAVDFVETSPQGEVDVQSVEVTGRFDNVPYQITVSDPFDLDVPLPTRNFTSDGTEETP
ncbi:MAG: hypothetical protein Phog2KO_47700 [Phototrophicaceae bacterium]